MDARYGEEAVEWSSKATERSTGWLEVTVVGGDVDKVLHSKRAGDGYIDSQAKLDTIFAGIDQAKAAAAAAAAAAAEAGATAGEE